MVDKTTATLHGTMVGISVGAIVFAGLNLMSLVPMVAGGFVGNALGKEKHVRFYNTIFLRNFKLFFLWYTILMKTEFQNINQTFTLGGFTYNGFKDFIFKFVKTYISENKKNRNYDAVFHLLQDKYDNFILEVYKKIPEFDEFDFGDHSYSYFVFKTELEADTFFKTIDIDRVDFYESNEKLQHPYIYRRGLSNYKKDSFHTIELK